MNDQTLCFRGKISGYPVEFILRAIVNEERLRLDYGFGIYHHLLEVDSTGSCVEVILRDNKIMFSDCSFPDDDWKYDKKVDPEYGKTINFFAAKLISGETNGVFGFGETKPKRVESCKIFFLVTEYEFYKFSVESEIDGCLLLVTLNLKQRFLEIGIGGSQSIRYDPDFLLENK